VRTLRVLSVRQSSSDSYQASAFRGHVTIINALRKYAEITEIWVIEKGGSSSSTYSSEVSLYNVFAFDDANDIIEKLKPDLILVYPGDYEFLSRSLLKAATGKGVPTVDIRLTDFNLSGADDSTLDLAKIIGRFYALTGRGGFIIKKYLFLLRTLSHAGYGMRYILQTVFKDIYLPFVYWFPNYRYGGGDLNIVSTPDWLNLLLRNGIPRNRIALTGDISMDSIYDKLARLESEVGNNNFGRNFSPNHTKKEILFITDSMVEHGFWTPQMRDGLVTSVVRSIKSELASEANLRIKIHPSSESISTYTNLLRPIYPDVEIIQDADILLLINQSDIIITFGLTSAIFQAILLNKPVFHLNFFRKNKLENPFIKENLVFECLSVEQLLNSIRAQNHANVDRCNLDAFIEKYIYQFDGKCSERAAEHILSLIDNSYKKPMDTPVL
jgi:hypothetical protein